MLRDLIVHLGNALGVDPQIQHHPVQPGDVECTYADVSKARALLSYNPQTPIDRGLQAFAAWARAYYAPAEHRSVRSNGEQGEQASEVGCSFSADYLL